VAISVNSARRATLRNARLVTNLVNGLPDSTRFLILTNDRSAFTIARNVRPDRVRFLELPYTNPITIWTQDPFLVLSGPQGSTLLASKAFERADDRLMAGAIARAAGFHTRASRLFFEGGNIVSDRQNVLIGANTIRRNALELGVPETEAVLRFEEELGRRVLVVGPFPQPIAHIDMMVTPLGDGRIVVADAAAGARIAEGAMREDPRSVAAFERWCEDHFFGHPAITELDAPDGPIAPPDVRGRTRDMIAWSRKVAPLLDNVARALGERGYRVERVPLLFGGPETHPPAEDGDAPMRAAYPMLTYNNVLIANDAGGNAVYLPRYGWQAMDEAAKEAWERLGFVAKPIEGLTISAMYGGALRCAVKVLAR
jgi:hypothetical protein